MIMDQKGDNATADLEKILGLEAVKDIDAEKVAQANIDRVAVYEAISLAVWTDC